MDDIAAALKEFRQQHSLEQEDLAKLLDTTQQTVSNWENGTMPRASALRKIGHLLKTYKAGETPTPLPPKPVLDPNITEIHEVKVNQQDGAARSVTAAVASGSNISALYTLEKQFPELGEVRRRMEYRERRRVEFTEVLAHEIGDHFPFTLDYTARFRLFRITADYLSKKVCAEFGPVLSHPSSRLSMERALYNLVTLRQCLGQEGIEPENFVLFIPFHALLSGRNNADARLNGLFSLGALHNIDVRVFGSDVEQTGAELAKKIAHILISIETGTDGDDAEYDEEPPT